jgi:thymidylate kinase
VTVAVVGPDGAGKTTLVEGLRRTLPFGTRIIYMGLTGGLMPKADALRVPGMVLGARLVIIWGRYGRGAYHRARGRVVLFDRYPLDGAVPPGFDPTPLVRLSRQVQRAACPLPDLVLFLDAPGQTMHGRKGEYTPERLETWRAAYKALRATVPMLEVIDAQQPVDRVLTEAQGYVWRRSRDRRAVADSRRAGSGVAAMPPPAYRRTAGIGCAAWPGIAVHTRSPADDPLHRREPPGRSVAPVARIPGPHGADRGPVGL